MGKPWVVGFCDGSRSTFFALIYVLLTLPKDIRDRGDQRFERKATLLMAKSRVAPVHGTTVPRIEMQGLTVLSHMINTTMRALPDKVEHAILVGDSRALHCLPGEDGRNTRSIPSHPHLRDS